MNEKRFSLFNIHQWVDGRPACCHVVPVLWQGAFDSYFINQVLEELKLGSYAAPGFMNPEGIMVFHTAGNNMFKVTCENDEKHKGEI